MDILGRIPKAPPFATIAASQLTAAPADGALPRRAGDAIEYTDDGRRVGARLFWGPFIALGAGVYLARLLGRLDGALAVDVAHDRGNRVVKQAVLAHFDRWICFVLADPVADLEVRGRKTDSLQGFTLHGIEIHRAYVAPRPDRLR